MIDISTAFTIAGITVLSGFGAGAVMNAIIGSATINKRFCIMLVGFLAGLAIGKMQIVSAIFGAM